MNKTDLVTYLHGKLRQSPLLFSLIAVVFVHGLLSLLMRLWGKSEKKKKNTHPSPDIYSAKKDDMVSYKPKTYSEKYMETRSNDFYTLMEKWRDVRSFSEKNVSVEVIENIVKTAGTSPRCALSEPWKFVVVKADDIKEQIRKLIEKEEENKYKQKMEAGKMKDLNKLKDSYTKEYLTTAPYLIVAFKEMYHITPEGEHIFHYYPDIDTSISCGILLAAIQSAGLVTLTSTPLNCGNALRQLLGRPENEEAVLLLPVGYPSKDCVVPNISRKLLSEVMTVL